MNYENEVMKEFVVESKEHLRSLEDDLLVLERQKEKTDGELVNKIFRAVHTIKGAAGFLGLDNINQLSHSMETLLSMIRSGELLIDTKITDTLLEGTDHLNVMMDDIENQQLVDISITIERLKHLLARRVSQDTKEDLENKLELLDSQNEKIGFSISTFDYKSARGEGKNIYLLKYELNKQCQEKSKSPISITQELLMIGDIMDGRLDTPLMDFSNLTPHSPLFYQVLYKCEFSLQRVMEILSLEKSQVDSLHVDSDDSQEVVEKNVCQNSNQKKEIEMSDDIKGFKEKEDCRWGQMENNASIRLNVSLLDRLMNLASELVLVRNQGLLHIDKSDLVYRSIIQRLDIVTSELQETVMRTRMQPIGNLLGKYQRLVRDLGKKLGKEIEISLKGNEVEIDKTILEALADPLTHIVRNSCDHGIETPQERLELGKNERGQLSIEAFHEAGQINILIKDDGKGIDPQVIKAKALEKGLRNQEELAHMDEKELISLIMLPGFSTANSVSDVSGRGVGMDVVRSNLQKLNGSLDISSEKAIGTTLWIKLPLTLAIIPCLIVKSGIQRFAIPQVNLEELVTLYDEEVFTHVECADNKEIYRLRNQLLSLVRLSEVLMHTQPFTESTRGKITEDYRKEREQKYNEYKKDSSKKSKGQLLLPGTLNIAVLRVGGERFGLIIDEVLGTEEIVVKPMHSLLRSLRCYAGSTVMGDGRVAMILDAEGLARHTGVLEGKLKEDKKGINPINERDKLDSQEVLLFKSGRNEQFAMKLSSIKRIEDIDLSNLEIAGEKEFITINEVPTRILQLHDFLNVSDTEKNKEMYLIIPKTVPYPCGILVSKLMDVTTITVNTEDNGYVEDGLSGTTVISSKMTMVVNLQRLLELATLKEKCAGGRDKLKAA